MYSTTIAVRERTHINARNLSHVRVAAAFADHRTLVHSSAMPQPELLETFENPYPDRDYEIDMTCPEFTSLCPLGGVESDATELALLKGGAPDFGIIRITYVPGDVCIELKSLKLYLWSFRNDGIFYERAVNRILDDLSACAKPRWMEVVGDFNVRGGIKSVIRARVGGRESGIDRRGTGNREPGTEKPRAMD